MSGYFQEAAFADSPKKYIGPEGSPSFREYAHKTLSSMNERLVELEDLSETLRKIVEGNVPIPAIEEKDQKIVDESSLEYVLQWQRRIDHRLGNVCDELTRYINKI